MAHPPWNESYASGEPAPWDTGVPDPLLVGVIESGAIAPGRTLEVGCGTGANAHYLAGRGFDVLGVDIAPNAVEQARAKAQGRCRFETLDFLTSVPPSGPFSFVFDRGCFHIFDGDQERAPPRDGGPPRRSARDVIDAIEPSLEIETLRSATLAVQGNPVKAWVCLSRKRAVPAQPSTRR
jgi:SAM-dependent methyltransferase